MNRKPLLEDTGTGGCVPFTRARIGGGDKKVVEKPVEKVRKDGLKPDSLTTFVSGYRKKG